MVVVPQDSAASPAQAVTQVFQASLAILVSRANRVIQVLVARVVIPDLAERLAVVARVDSPVSRERLDIQVLVVPAVPRGQVAFLGIPASQAIPDFLV